MNTITLEIDKLKKNFELLSSVSQKTNTLPVLESTLIEIKDNKISYYATNLNISINIEDDITAEDVTFLIETSKFNSILKNINSSTIDITIDKGINIEDGFDVYNLPLLSSDDFPEKIIKPKEEIASLDIETTTILAGLYKAAKCVANDDTRPVMNGIFISKTDEGIDVVGTDAHTLSQYKIKTGAEVPRPFELIISKEVFTSLMKYKHTGVCYIVYDERNVFINLDNIIISSVIIEGKYPSYKKVIPELEEMPLKVTCSKENLITALKKVSTTLNSNKILVMSFFKDEIKMQSEDLDYNHSSAIKVDCSDGPEEEFTIGVKHDFLLKGVESLVDYNVVLNMSKPEKSIVLTDGGDNYIFLVMPVMINND